MISPNRYSIVRATRPTIAENINFIFFVAKLLKPPRQNGTGIVGLVFVSAL